MEVVADNKDAAASPVGSGKQVQLPFVLEMKRPGKSRVEIEFAGKTAVQVYDGANGWKVRPFLNRNEVQPFTAEEAKSESTKAELDGPLVDYVAKGTKVELESREAVEGRDAYKLKVTNKAGNVQHIWIDSQNFFDVKVEGAPRRMDGRMRTVWVYQRDFRPVQGLMVPFTLETAVDGSRDTHKMVIEKVAVNPKLDDALFAKPKA
jgi:outer membrane lipoprotein-sorting protein